MGSDKLMCRGELFLKSDTGTSGWLCLTCTNTHWGILLNVIAYENSGCKKNPGKKLFLDQIKSDKSLYTKPVTQLFCVSI